MRCRSCFGFVTPAAVRCWTRSTSDLPLSAGSDLSSSPGPEPVALDRRALEVCVFVHLAAALQAGDVYVVGSENFADYRAQLLPWAECEPRLPAYCAALGMPERGEDFAAS